MKKIILSFILLMTPMLLFSQGLPHTFQNGEIIDATKFNENFKIVSSGIRKGTVDCDAGESINEKLKEYNHLKISGICTENVLIDFQKRSSGIPGSNWDNSTGVQHYVALIGENNSSLDGIKAQDPNEKVIKVNGPVTVLVEGLTISGGDDGIKGYWGALVGVRNTHIENNSNNGFVIERGMGAVLDSTISNNHNGIVALYGSRLYVDNSTIENHEGAGIGIWLGANGLIGNKPENDENGNKDFTRPRGNIITGSRTGVSVADTSFARLIGNTITCYKNQGIWASESSTLDLGVNHDRADLTDTTNPLNYSHSNYATNKLTYGNLIDGAACSGVDREDWQNGVDVRESTALRMYRNVIKNNSAHGVRAEAQSSIVLGGGNEIRDNDDNGFDLSGSTLNQWDWDQEHEPSVVENNGRDAFNLNYSELNLRGGWVWDDDSNSVTSKTHKFMISGHRRGIAAHRNSSVTLQRVEIKDNTETGIDLYDGSNLNIWFDRTNEDESDGVVISGNGIATDSNNHRAGLRINNGSTANVDFVKIIGNGRGIEVRDNSILKGGWSASENSALTYGIIIKDNKREGLRIQNNSTAHMDFVNVENNAVDEVTDDGHTWRDTAISVRDSSVLDMDRSRIANNNDSVLRVSGKSYAHFYDIEVDSNGGDTAFRVDSSKLEISGVNANDENSVYLNPVKISGHNYGIRAKNSSTVNLRRVKVQDNYNNGISISEGTNLNIWFDRNNGTADDGVVISGNGLKDENGILRNSNDFRAGLRIDSGSIADIDYVEIIGNGRGIELQDNSVIKGGWVAKDTNALTYGIIIKDNKREGLKLRNNSTAHMDFVNVENNAVDEVTDDGHTWRDTAISVRDSSVLDMDRSRIANNNDSVLRVSGKSYAHFYDIEVDSNGGHTAFSVDSSELEITGADLDNDEDHIYSTPIVISNHDTGIQVSNGSRLVVNRVEIRDNNHRGISLGGNSVMNVWRGGLTLSGNGLNNVGWSGFGPALDIHRNSSASVDRLVVSGNGRGIFLGHNSNLSGGWKDENDTTLPTHMIEIKDNKKWAIEVKANSNLDFSNFNISGNSIHFNQNNDGSKFYEESVKIYDNSNANLNKGLIENNSGSAIKLRNNSNLDLHEVNFNNNGIGPETNGQYRSIKVSNSSQIYLNNSNLNHDGYGGALSIWEMSSAHLRNTIISNSLGHGINVSQKSKISLISSSITSNYEFIEEGQTNGSNGIEATSYSLIEIWHDSNISNNSNTITAAAFPLKARNKSEISIGSALELTSSLEWSEIYLEKGSKLYLNDTNEGIQTINRIGMTEESEFHLNSNLWNIKNIHCSNVYDNGTELFRKAITYFNGNNNNVLNNDNECILLN